MIRSNLHHFDILARLAPAAGSYLEVGVREGDSLAAVIRANPNIRRLTLCDDWGERHGGTGRGSGDHIVRMLGEMGWDGDLEIMSGRSQETLNLTRNLTPFDLSLVDGSHDYFDALQDLRNVWALTSYIMVVHDTSIPDVYRALAEWGGGKGDIAVELALADRGTAVVRRVR